MDVDIALWVRMVSDDACINDLGCLRDDLCLYSAGHFALYGRNIYWYHSCT